MHFSHEYRSFARRVQTSMNLPEASLVAIHLRLAYDFISMSLSDTRWTRFAGEAGGKRGEWGIEDVLSATEILRPV